MNFDLARLSRQQSELGLAIDALADLEAAPLLASRQRAFLRDTVGDGLDGLAATCLVSACNDRLTQAIIAATARHHRLPPVGWCWLALGSEGRHEQTFVTDQDNGLIFNAAGEQEAEVLRSLFLPFAQEVNRRLADCGFTLCSGGIMAGNPSWCLSLDEWREQFISWVRRPDPAALLNASIFFDLRPLHGDLDLGEQLRNLLLSMTVATPSFQHLMASNALQAEVPLNFRADVADNDPLDLKKFGSRIFVDAARILALACGERAVNTRQRLRLAGPKNGLQTAEIAAAEAAFGHILRLRLNAQLVADVDACTGHELIPGSLHEMDRAILREGLKLARRLQQRLKLNYLL